MGRNRYRSRYEYAIHLTVILYWFKLNKRAYSRCVAVYYSFLAFIMTMAKWLCNQNCCKLYNLLLVALFIDATMLHCIIVHCMVVSSQGPVSPRSRKVFAPGKL